VSKQNKTIILKF